MNEEEFGVAHHTATNRALVGIAARNYFEEGMKYRSDSRL
jgi:hypothetical protein